MADELTYNANVRFIKGGLDTGQVSLGSNLKFSITGTRATRLAQSIGFSAREALDLGEITAPGHLIVKNLDSTNFVNVFTDVTTGTGVAKLFPSEFCIIPTHSALAAPAAQADTAAVLVDVLVIER